MSPMHNRKTRPFSHVPEQWFYNKYRSEIILAWNITEGTLSLFRTKQPESVADLFLRCEYSRAASWGRRTRIPSPPFQTRHQN